MIASNKNNRSLVFDSDYVRAIRIQNKLYLLLLGIVSVSFLGFFIFRGTWLGLIFGHLAGLSIMGFYGGLTEVIAVKKGYKYFFGFKIGLIIPIVFGIISAFILVPYGKRNLFITCGGWTALGSGLIIVIIFLFIKKKNLNGGKSESLRE